MTFAGGARNAPIARPLRSTVIHLPHSLSASPLLIGFAVFMWILWGPYQKVIIDRFTRWPEAIPLPDAHAYICASALLHHWVARFGVPEDIVSDRGRQFISNLWSELNKLLGIDTNTTTAYHPQANGMVERLHRQLKAALKARTTGPDWFDQLPMVLLGIRSSWRVDPDCSPAELVYGTTLRIPGEFLQPCDTSTTTPDITFLRNLQQTMHSIQPPAPKFHGNQTCYVPSTLATAKYVYVRKDSHKHPLHRPYYGPFRVVSKSDKYFTLNIKGRPETVSIDRLKTAYVTRLTIEENKEVLISPKSILTDNLKPSYTTCSFTTKRWTHKDYARWQNFTCPLKVLLTACWIAPTHELYSAGMWVM